MSNPFKKTIEVEIENLTVEEGSFSFDYKVTVNDHLISSDSYTTKHDWREANDLKWLKTMLRKHVAVEIALSAAL